MIIHVDMDAYYASVEERDDPRLRGKPLIVGGSADGRGVVCAANYVARTYGIHSAMPTARALSRCPACIVLKPRMQHYAEISQHIRGIFERYTPVIEPLSLDEAFLDVTPSEKLFGSPAEIGRRIKTEIWNELNLVASVGVAPNKFSAKIASDFDKPDGFVVIPPDELNAFLDPLPIGLIWGVGKVTNRFFQKLGIKTIGQLRALPRRSVDDLFGKSAEHFWNLSHGIDNRRVVRDRDAKSISHETTFALDINDMEILRSWLMGLTEQVARRLRNHQLYAKSVHLKVRYSNFDTVTRARQLPRPSHSTDELWETALELLNTRLPDREIQVRLLGMGVSQITGDSLIQRTLFDESESKKRSRLDAVSDEIKSRFGSTALQRGTASQRKRKE